MHQPQGIFHLLTGFAKQLEATRDCSDRAEMVMDSLDDLFAHADISEAREFEDRRLFARARARLFEEGYDVVL